MISLLACQLKLAETMLVSPKRRKGEGEGSFSHHVLPPRAASSELKLLQNCFIKPKDLFDSTSVPVDPISP